MKNTSNIAASRAGEPRLTVLGAGPGDPELLTVKGVNVLRTADVVLYDALVNTALLTYAPANSLKIYVGKRANKKALEQEDINRLIVTYARSFGHVVRLKGGDPFVFGRGMEEMQYATQYNIPVSYVPGISSAIAVAGAAGIAVTQRGASRSFWVLTATTDTGDFNPELLVAARTDATVVVLMGLAKITEIAAAYTAAGKPDVPAAVVQNGTLPNERQVTGLLSELPDLIARHGIGSPAVIVIGAVTAQGLLEQAIFQAHAIRA